MHLKNFKGIVSRFFMIFVNYFVD